MVRINPVTNQRWTKVKHSGDFVLPSVSNSNVLDNEDVRIVGDWTDSKGDGKRSKWEVMLAGITDSLADNDAHLRGARYKRKNSRGNSAQTVRSRQRDYYFER